LSTVADPAVAVESRVALRVRYPETDRMGVAYHAHYLVWFELGRTELMREVGCAYAALEDRDGILFPVVRVNAHYRVSARYDDELELHTRLVGLGASRVCFEYRLTRPSDAALLATGSSEHAAVGRNGRPLRLPAELRSRLSAAAK
jgi:acyl-CoA thioester hydrolase